LKGDPLFKRLPTLAKRNAIRLLQRVEHQKQAVGQARIQRAQASASAVAEQNTTKQQKLESCIRSLGMDLVARLKGMSITEARPILAAHCDDTETNSSQRGNEGET
jgi:hypothetical protein